MTPESSEMESGEDFGFEHYSRALLNILEDAADEKGRLEQTQTAMLNLVEDFSAEKGRLEETQTAMLNLLEDFDVERVRAEDTNRELREAFDSLRRAKEAADAANRELEAFSYSVSHDLRAPLRAIDGFSLALLEDYDNLLDPEGRDYLERVRSSTLQMAQLIDDLLRLSRLTRSEMNVVEVDLSALAWEVAQELRSLQPKREVSFEIEKAVSAPGDPNFLRVVFENLLGNAWKFSGDKSQATIEFGCLKSKLDRTFYVRDDGAGFDMAFSDKLFATFQRLHREDEFAGTGIGLSLVQRIIHRLGGTIWAEGEVGVGACFYFTLNPTE